MASACTAKMPGCKVCGQETVPFGEKRGNTVACIFRFCRCPACGFIFIVNPCLDFKLLCNADYYAGNGADPYVDYHFELEHPEETIRRYEWRGIETVGRRLAGNLDGARWLDYGCGNGGLVRHLRAQGIDAVGFDDGEIVPRARAKGIPILTDIDLEREAGRISIVTMIEVIEHLSDPIPILRRIRCLLKPGGLLFLTTGNSVPHRRRFNDWSYVIPDIHVSYFDPHNLGIALGASGFSPEFPGHIDGWDDIIRFKFLKTIGWRKSGLLEHLVPWKIASKIIDAWYRASAHPIGRAT
jgi:SAM-dependent methyltransferase